MADDSVVQFHPAIPKARRALARYLREMADIIDADMADVEPNAALIVLTGRTKHEVVWTGGDTEPRFLYGALEAARAVLCTPYDTVGGHQRPRTHSYGAGKQEAQVVTLIRRPDATQEGE